MLRERDETNCLLTTFEQLPEKSAYLFHTFCLLKPASGFDAPWSGAGATAISVASELRSVHKSHSSQVIHCSANHMT